MPRRLKVFQAQVGFYDTVVAAASQAEALRVWGTHQNLFASGQAGITTDKAAVAAALEHPGTLLRRAVGSGDPFLLQPSSLPRAPDAPKRPRARAAPKQKPAEHKRPPADRSRLHAAEAALHKVEEARKVEEADLRRKQDRLDQARADAQRAYVERRKAAEAAVLEARKAYRAAGGQV